MSIRITNFTIEKARNGYILDNDIIQARMSF